ncbi:hypothetical protein [Flaviflexus huanghaiensis]|uniref:hypothetical protein n=1 Tax=Flaviflexus huanghaiensis TaxID=1111473 RepID=UPI0015FAD7F7|nr:hypothetical protein [Flaviflexus huanghaiensis]
MSHDISPFAELSGTQTARWVALLPKIALGVFLVGGIIAAIFWVTASDSVGQDLSILSLCISFALMVTFMSVRELIKVGDDD